MLKTFEIYTCNNRFKDAVAIQQGACNPRAIVRALLCAIESVEGGTTAICNDPAVRLIAHQLSYLLNVEGVDKEFGVYTKLIDECEAKIATQEIIS
jgi:hypothetical protein